MRAIPKNPVQTIQTIAEVLVISTGAGATIGAEIAGTEGAKVGAMTGLAVGVALLVYWGTQDESEGAPYRAFVLGSEGQ